jgi:glycosyltransferase involved in cell wall biosynthesis
MRIAIISPVFPPYKSGIGQAAYQEALELARRGHKVSVYTPKPKKFKEIKVTNFNLHYLRPFLKYGNAAFLPQLFWKLSAFGDVIHLHYPFFGGAEVIWRWKLATRNQQLKINNQKSAIGNQKLIITYHHDAIGRGLLGRFFKWHTKYLMPKILSVADKIIVSSFDYAKNSNIKDIFEKNPEKFVEIPFGIDIEKFQPMAKNDEILKRYGLKVDDKIILFVGGLDKPHYFKGLEILMKAKTLIPEAKLLVVGNGNLVPYYKKLANDLKINRDVIFAGQVFDEDLPKYYNLADVVVLPSVDRSEAFGIVLLEAAACAKPIIASNLPGVRSVVIENLNGFLVEPRNVGELAKKVNALLFNKILKEKLGKNGRRIILEKYDIKKVGDRLEKVLAN